MNSTIKHISFSKKPIPIPAEYRPVYKMAQLIFILKISCSGNKASLLKLHLLSWSIKNEKNREELTSLIHNNYNGNLKTWGVDPAVNRALIYCVAEKLCSVEKGKYLLTPKGNDFFELLDKAESLLEKEKFFLQFLGKSKITDSRIMALSKKWAL